jgi:uncharacterized protein (TIGR03032 family)
MQDPAPNKGESAASYREVRYEHSHSFPALLSQLGISLLVSTYQAGKLVVLGTWQGKLSLSFHNFERPMGLALRPGCLAVGARNQIWFLPSAPDIAPRLEPAGKYDACYLARSSHVTAEIQCHEMGWAGDDLWIVNTLFSCLCTLDANHSFVPRWQPPFISALAAEDRCHLNGLAMADGRPKYVTALAQTDTPQGWRPNKAQSGCLIDVPSGRTIAEGFAMPHSPRVHQGQLWLLDSGRGALVRVDPASGAVATAATLPGYTRGLALHSPYAFVGLSKIRETSTFGGVPIAEQRDALKCGVGIIELTSGRLVAHFEFTAGVDEIFDVLVLPGSRLPALRGPHITDDESASIWLVPGPMAHAGHGATRSPSSGNF